MGGGGGDVSTSQPYDVDQGQLAQFMTTAAGQQYASMYNSKNGYVQVGESIQAYDNNGQWGPGGPTGFQTVGPDVRPMIDAFHSWAAANQQSQTNWQAYANQVSANEGGQGDNTVTVGAAAGQRQTLLGSLANAGNTPAASADGSGVGNPNNPTPGLGSAAMAPPKTVKR
jgi:hypothetical protein